MITPNKVKSFQVQSIEDVNNQHHDRESFPARVSNDPANTIFYISKKDLLSSEIRQPIQNFESEPVISLIQKDNTKPCVLAYFVLPALSVFYWMLLVPYRISYDTTSQTYFKITGSLLRKVICFTFDLLTVVYYIGQLKLILKTSNTGAIGVLYEITYTSFILFTTATLYVFWIRMDNIVQIFIEIDKLQNQFISSGMNFQRSKKIHVIKRLIYGIYVYLIISFPFFITGYDRIFLPLLNKGLTIETMYEIAKKTTDLALLSTLPLVGVNPPANGTEIYMRDWLIISIALFYQLVDILSGCVWLLSNLVVLMWGFVFLRLVQSFLLKSKANRYMGGRVLEDIRDFNSITSILDNFNQVLGILTFFLVVAAILYISTTAGQMFLSTSDGSLVKQIVYITSFLPFIFVLGLASEVNRMASEFPSLLKAIYNYKNGLCWTQQTKNNQLEVLQGLAIVHYDIANNVGFQGLRFFTISYSFIGTVISVIASYAVVALQLSTPASATVSNSTPLSTI